MPGARIIDTLLLPNALWGKPAVVRKRARDIIRTAHELGWAEADNKLDLVPASDYSRDLYVGRPIHGGDPGGPLWRLYAISEAILDVLIGDHCGTEAKHDMVASGMDRLWFLLGLYNIGGGSMRAFDLDSVSEDVARIRAEVYLSRFVNVLDELNELSPHLRWIPEYEIVRSFSPDAGPLWWFEILSLLDDVGRPLPLRTFIDTYRCDLTAALIGEGIVRRVKNGYELILQ